jgi:hypothetical protein
MPINASPHFERAQREYEAAQTTEQKIQRLKKMISLAPSHKGAENLRAQLKRRLAKLKYTKEKESKSGKSTYKGIKKAEMQAVIIGLTNSGKSSLLSAITNANPKIAGHEFTTTNPVIGILNYQECQIQLIENPSIESEYYDKGLTHTADVLLVIINKLQDLEKITPSLHSKAKKIIIFNIKDEVNERKLESTLKSKKLNFIIIDLKTKQNLNELKEKIFTSFNNIRVFTKEPGKPKSEKPIILGPKSTVKDVAEKIFHGFSKQVKETRITGPSSKFPNQKTGLKHVLKDLDVIEFKTR